jgi:hypothetical protein
MNADGPMTRSDRVATLEEAKAQLQASWDAWKEWAKRWRIRTTSPLDWAQTQNNTLWLLGTARCEKLGTRM